MMEYRVQEANISEANAEDKISVISLCLTILHVSIQAHVYSLEEPLGLSSALVAF